MSSFTVVSVVSVVSVVFSPDLASRVRGPAGKTKKTRETRETREITTKSGIIFHCGLCGLCDLCGLFTRFAVRVREPIGKTRKTRKTRETTTKSGIIIHCGLCGLFTQFSVKSARATICSQKGLSTTLGKNPDDGLYLAYCSLSGLFVRGSNRPLITAKRISCQKGLGLAHRKSECLGIVQEVQPEALNFLGWVENDPFSQEIIIPTQSWQAASTIYHRLRG